MDVLAEAGHDGAVEDDEFLVGRHLDVEFGGVDAEGLAVLKGRDRVLVVGGLRLVGGVVPDTAVPDDLDLRPRREGEERKAGKEEDPFHTHQSKLISKNLTSDQPVLLMTALLPLRPTARRRMKMVALERAEGRAIV